MYFYEKGEFIHGKLDYENASLCAKKCQNFKLDNDYEEMASGGERSCYDCAFRRWSKDSFFCMVLAKRANLLG
jgi:molybdopterin biosynthesis protein moeB